MWIRDRRFGVPSFRESLISTPASTRLSICIFYLRTYENRASVDFFTAWMLSNSTAATALDSTDLVLLRVINDVSLRQRTEGAPGIPDRLSERRSASDQKAATAARRQKADAQAHGNSKTETPKYKQIRATHSHN